MKTGIIINKLYLTPFILFSFWSISLPASELPVRPGEPLRLEGVLENVEKSYPIVLVAESALSAAEYEVLESEGAFDATWKIKGTTKLDGYYDNKTLNTIIERPTPLFGVSLYAGYRLGQGEFPVYDEKLITNDEGEIRAGIKIPLLRDLKTDKRRAGLAKAKIDRDKAKLRLSMLRLEVVREASKRYWKWVAAGQKYRVAQDLLKIAELRASQIEQRVRLGDLAPMAKTENDRSIRKRKAKLITQKREFEKAALELSLILRTPEGQMIRPEDRWLPQSLPVPLLPEEQIVRQATEEALMNRPDLKEYALKTKKADIDKRLAENELLPRFDVMIEASRDMGAGSETRRPSEVEAKLFIEIPLETRLARGKMGQAKSFAKQLEAERKFALEKIQVEVIDAYSAMRAAKETWINQKEELVLAKDLEQAERTRFRLGDTSLLTVNIREQETAESAMSEIESRVSYFTAVADFEAIRAAGKSNPVSYYADESQ